MRNMRQMMLLAAMMGGPMMEVVRRPEEESPIRTLTPNRVVHEVIPYTPPRKDKATPTRLPGESRRQHRLRTLELRRILKGEVAYNGVKHTSE